jgi:oligoribonuclease
MSELPRTPAYVWLDTEFTSLDIERADLLQVAVLLTDADLERLAPPEEDLNLAVRLSADATVSPWVEENLGSLVQQCRSGDALPLPSVEQRICSLVDRLTGGPHEEPDLKPVIAGNSVHADYYLLRRLMPDLIRRCHYRLLDVSAIKIQWQDCARGQPFAKDDPDQIRRHWPGARLSQGIGAHDAYYDIQASIAELAFYRSSFFPTDIQAGGES